MNTPSCTCPSGDGSLRWPCPAHPPELPPLPGHPEPHAYRWSKLEEEAIRAYGQQCIRAALASKLAAEVAPEMIKAAVRLVVEDHARRGLPDALNGVPVQAEPAEPSEFRGARRRDAAEATLTCMGYAWRGGELWAPPIGKAPRFAEPPQAQQAAQGVPAGFVLFPSAARSDVLTAAGLVRHGKQCKALADRLGEAVQASWEAPPQAQQADMHPLEPWERWSLENFRACVGRWHRKAVAKGYDGVESMCDTALPYGTRNLRLVEPAQAQQAEAKPLTERQIAVALGWKPGCGPLRSEVEDARAIERACADDWGVKLAGISASSDGAG